VEWLRTKAVTVRIMKKTSQKAIKALQRTKIGSIKGKVDRHYASAYGRYNPLIGT
jgi:hypothetical protein